MEMWELVVIGGVYRYSVDYLGRDVDGGERGLRFGFWVY